MSFASTYSIIIGLILFAGMLLLLEAGRRWGQQSKPEELAGARAGLGAIDAAVFSLLGLLVAFSFSGAAMRFDARRQLSVQESNCIGTAWLRIDALPSENQPELRDLFRQYVDARLQVAAVMPDLEAAHAVLKHCSELQSAIWTYALNASQVSSTPVSGMLLLPALNQMFDIASTRTATAYIHPPLIIFAMLIILSLASALMAGHEMAGAKRRSWLHVIGLAAAVSAAVFIIVDLEYPRAGLIRLNSTERSLQELRQSMEEKTMIPP